MEMGSGRRARSLFFRGVDALALARFCKDVAPIQEGRCAVELIYGGTFADASHLIKRGGQQLVAQGANGREVALAERFKLPQTLLNLSCSSLAGQAPQFVGRTRPQTFVISHSDESFE